MKTAAFAKSHCPKPGAPRKPDPRRSDGLTDLCVYTIKQGNDLRDCLASRCGEFTVGTKWVRAKELLDEARVSGNRLPVIFARAEGGQHLFAWALLDKVVVATAGTTYRFSGLTRFKRQTLVTTLKKDSDGEPLSAQYSRPYAICRTPPHFTAPRAGEGTGKRSVSASTHREGGVQRVLVTRYERKPRARIECIEHYGVKCILCGFDFAGVYGEAMAAFIHVHHLKDLSAVGPDYEVDPIRDLRPVCPNCHAVLHDRKPAYSLDEVRRFLNSRAGSRD